MGNRFTPDAQQLTLDESEPIQDLGEYAAIFWPTHYQACDDLYSRKYPTLNGKYPTLAKETQRYYPGLDMDRDDKLKLQYWIRNVQIHLSQTPLGFYDKEVEMQLHDAILLPPNFFFVTCVYRLTRIVRQICEEQEQSDDELGGSKGEQHQPSTMSRLPVNELGLTGLHLAYKFRRLETVQYLCPANGSTESLKATDNQGVSALERAVGAAKDMGLILGLPRKARQLLTPRLLVAAIENPWYGEDLTKFF